MELKEIKVIINNINNINSDRLITCTRIRVNDNELALKGMILIDKVHNELFIFYPISGVMMYRLDIDKIESFSCEIKSCHNGEVIKPICTISDISCLNKNLMIRCFNIKVNSQLVCKYGSIFLSDYKNALFIYDKEGKLITIFKLDEITDFSCDLC